MKPKACDDFSLAAMPLSEETYLTGHHSDGSTTTLRIDTDQLENVIMLLTERRESIECSRPAGEA